MSGGGGRAASAGTTFVIALVLTGCSEGSPASPNAGAADEGDAGSESAEAGFNVCPPAIEPTFTSILTKVLATPSCGTNVVGDCHSQSGASPSGTGNLLDYTLDAGAVYDELLGDGGGHPSTNLAGNAGPIPRVAPFDAGASMLYIKLTLTTHDDPRYGAGMPLTAPGSVCPATLDAVKTWIDQGATQLVTP
jgi:hypothetical protein